MSDIRNHIVKIVSFGMQLGAGAFWFFIFLWLVFLIWDPNFKVSEPHSTMQVAITGLLVWMLGFLIKSVLLVPDLVPEPVPNLISGYGYPYGETKTTLNFIVLFTVLFLVFTILGLSTNINSNSFKSLIPWLAFFTQGNREILLVAVAAGLGSSLATILAFIQHAIYIKDFKGRYMPWYLLRPMMGTVLGVIFYFLIKGGLLALTNVSEQQGLDLYALAGMATLVGFFSRSAIEKLQEVFDAMFSSTDKKVAISKAETKRAQLAARNATFSILKTTIEARSNPQELKTLEDVWSRISDENWTIGSGDEANLMATLKERLKNKMTDEEKNILAI